LNDVTSASIAEVRSLLEGCGLPTDDLNPKRVEFLAVRRSGAIAGCVGIELYGSQALIRSLAVGGVHRGRGIGGALLQAALARAIAAGATEVFGVTIGAADYLVRFGFEPIDRAGLVSGVAQSSQLQGACPTDAVVLRRSLRPMVLFMCVHNAGRSQMAAALLAKRAGDRVEVRSAGSEPAYEINPSVLEAMGELCIDLSREVPKKMTFEMARAADVVVTMGCGDACPVFPGKRYVDWELPDPGGLSVEEVRPIRDEIERRVDVLISELGL
jgi:arsenate reductase (thioredoxin)